MVGHDGVENVAGFTEFLGQVRADDGVGAFDLVVNGLAKVVEQAGALGPFYVHAQFGGHDAGQGGHFQGVLEHVLGVAGAVLELAEQAHELGVDAVNAAVEGGLLADLTDLDVKFLLALLDDVLNAGGMDTAVGNEALQGHLGDLALERRKGRQDDGLGGVVDDEVDAGGGFQGADVAAFAADDAALHFLGGQGHGGDGLLAHEIAGIALDGQGQDLFPALVGSLLGLHLDLADHAGGLVAGLGLDLVHEALFGLFHGQAGDFLKPLVVLVGQAGKILGLFGQFTFLGGETLFRGQHLGFLLDDQLLLFFQTFPALVDLFFFFFQGLGLVAEFLFEFLFLAEQLVLGGDHDFLFVGGSFLAGLVQDAVGQGPGFVQGFLGNPLVEIVAGRHAEANAHDAHEDGRKFHAFSRSGGEKRGIAQGQGGGTGSIRAMRGACRVRYGMGRGMSGRPGRRRPVTNTVL